MNQKIGLFKKTFHGENSKTMHSENETQQQQTIRIATESNQTENPVCVTLQDIFHKICGFVERIENKLDILNSNGQLQEKESKTEVTFCRPKQDDCKNEPNCP